MQWAMILLPGKECDQTFLRSYRNWLKTDTPSREAFVELNGIK